MDGFDQAVMSFVALDEREIQFSCSKCVFFMGQFLVPVSMDILTNHYEDGVGHPRTSNCMYEILESPRERGNIMVLVEDEPMTRFPTFST